VQWRARSRPPSSPTAIAVARRAFTQALPRRRERHPRCEGRRRMVAHLRLTYVKRTSSCPKTCFARAPSQPSCASAGYSVEDRRYPLASACQGLPDPAPAVHVIVARNREKTRCTASLSGRSYDTQSGTVQGAYDNGSGTALVVQLCKDLAHVALNRTLHMSALDGEEDGPARSGAFVDNDVKATRSSLRPLPRLRHGRRQLAGLRRLKLYGWTGASSATRSPRS